MTAALDHLIAFWLHFWPVAAFFLAAQLLDTGFELVQRARGQS